MSDMFIKSVDLRVVVGDVMSLKHAQEELERFISNELTNCSSMKIEQDLTGEEPTLLILCDNALDPRYHDEDMSMLREFVMEEMGMEFQVYWIEEQDGFLTRCEFLDNGTIVRAGVDWIQNCPVQVIKELRSLAHELIGDAP